VTALTLRRKRPSHLLIDAGVWIAAEAPEERFFGAAKALLGRARWHAAALDLTLYEVANALGAKRGEAVRAAAACREIELRCAERFVRVGGELIADAAQTASDHGLTAYDAAYVAVARRYEWTLVSTDIRDLVSRGLAITPDAAV
jgi:predicted nucleic acid-binding protein